MFAGKEVEQLEETKRLLIAQAEIHRGILRVEAAVWGDRVARLQKLRESVGAYRGILMAVAAAAGLLAAKRGRSLFKWIPWALDVWRTVRQFLRPT